MARENVNTTTMCPSRCDQKPKEATRQRFKLTLGYPRTPLIATCYLSPARRSMAPNAPNVESIPASPVATPPSTCTLLDLSTEVLIEILSYLPVADMLSAQHTCRTIRDIVVGTAYLQYILHAEINGIDDVLPPNFPYSERVELLRRHEQSWNELSLNLFTACVPDLDG